MGANEDWESLKALADRLFDDDQDDDKESYIGKHMKRLGYRARATWEDSDDNSDDNSDDLFGKRRERRQVPNARRREPESKRGSGRDWQYGS
jgi:hypothetical protein